MYIKCLVENIKGSLKPKHGLCFYVETFKHKILFDLGPNNLFYKNALKCGIDISKVDTVVISHGHIDHGGGLRTFLEHNNTAKIYVQEPIFEKHYTKFLMFDINIGIDASFKNHKQIVFVRGNYKIDDELALYVCSGHKLPSPMNFSLLDKDKNVDSFNHEQNLLITENKKVLFTGCSHNGIFNIINSVDVKVDVLIGGFHLFNPVNKKMVSKDYLLAFKNELVNYDMTFYTCHCTGLKAFLFLKSNNIKYINCGMHINI